MTDASGFDNGVQPEPIRTNRTRCHELEVRQNTSTMVKSEDFNLLTTNPVDEPLVA
jgi:hypothetical protein